MRAQRKPTDDELLALMGGGDVEDQGALSSFLDEQASLADESIAPAQDLSAEDQDLLAMLAEADGQPASSQEPQQSEALQRLDAMGQRPRTPVELPDAPPMVQRREPPSKKAGKSGWDTTTDVLALFLDAMLNDGRNIPGLIGNMQRERAAYAEQNKPDTRDVDYENYKRQIQHAKDVSGLQPKGPDGLKLESARLAREKFEADQARREGELSWEEKQALLSQNRRSDFDYMQRGRERIARAGAGRGIPGAPSDVDAQIASIQGMFDGEPPASITPLLDAARGAAQAGQAKKAAELLKVARATADDVRSGKRVEQADARLTRAEEKERQADMRQYAKAISDAGLPEAEELVSRLEKNIAEARAENGGSIFSPKDDAIRRGPQQFWGLMSDRAKAIMADVQKTKNIEIKDTSGVAVSDSEMDRVEAGIGTNGAFGTESDLVRFVTKKKGITAKARKHWQATFPEASKAHQANLRAIESTGDGSQYVGRSYKGKTVKAATSNGDGTFTLLLENGETPRVKGKSGN